MRAPIVIAEGVRPERPMRGAGDQWLGYGSPRKMTASIAGIGAFTFALTALGLRSRRA